MWSSKNGDFLKRPSEQNTIYQNFLVKHTLIRAPSMAIIEHFNIINYVIYSLTSNTVFEGRIKIQVNYSLIYDSINCFTFSLPLYIPKCPSQRMSASRSEISLSDLI